MRHAPTPMYVAESGRGAYRAMREGNSSSRLVFALLATTVTLSILLLGATLGRGGGSAMGTQLRQLQVFVHTETEAVIHRGGDESSATVSRDGVDDCAFDPARRSKTLKVFQVYKEPPTRLMDHNRLFLPSGAEFAFHNDEEEMAASMKEASELLEACGVVMGAYEAFAGLRAISTRTNIWRAAMLWMHGGLYMDHKVVLTQPLSNFVDFDHDTILLPKDFRRVTPNMKRCCPSDVPVQTSILWSLPKHPILTHILRLQVKRARSHFYGYSPIEVTGPMAFIQAAHQYEGPFQPQRDIVIAKEKKHQRFDLRTGERVQYTRFFKFERGGGIVAVWDDRLHKGGRDRNNYHVLWTKRALYCVDPLPANINETCNL